MNIKRLLTAPLCLFLFAATGCASARKEYMELAGINTIMGILIVFSVLILISFVIAGFRIISMIENKTKKELGSDVQNSKTVVQSEKRQEKDNQARTQQNSRELADYELAAIIAAAIAATENRSPDDFIVRSIRRR